MKTLVVFAVLSILSLADAADLFGRKLRPVVFLPGLEGSRLEVRRTQATDHCDITNDNFTLLWLDPVKILASLNCFMDSLRLHYDPVTRTTHNSPGVQIRVPFFGETEGVETMNIIPGPDTIIALPLVSFFVLRGYERGVNFRTAPYDWRKAANELGDFFDRLKNLIEETYEQQGQQRIVLMTHSMGGMNALHFLQQQEAAWKEKYIHKFVPISGPFGGSVESLSVYLTGLDTLGLLPFLSDNRIIHAITSLPAVAYLLPNRYVFDSSDVLIQSQNWTITIDNLYNLFDLLNLPTAKYIYNDTKNLLGQNLDHPGVNITCVYSYGLLDKKTAYFDREEDFPFNPRWTWEDGDGLVNIKSLQSCLRWKENTSFTFSSKVFDAIIHADMIRDLRPISFFYQLVTRD